MKNFKNSNWLELIVKGLKDNISLCGENTIIAWSDGNPITASKMLELIETDDPIITKFYEDIVGVAIRTLQLRSKNGITKLKGLITHYDSNLGYGLANLENSTIIKFHSTSFQSKPPTRFPIVGEWIKAIYQEDRLLSVRSL